MKEAIWNAFTVFALSLPAAVVWFTISMLKGDAYTVGITVQVKIIRKVASTLV